MSSWKSCENCADKKICYTINGVYLSYKKQQLQFKCSNWRPMRCRCGGALSTIREHNGKLYRHCYSCHFEFFEDGLKDEEKTGE